jgi:small subunit ribosomal protein S20
MANTKSADKRARQALKRRDRNRDHVSTMRTAVKRLRKAVASGDAKTAQDLLGNTVKVVDSTAQKGVIHRNAAARTKSRLTKAVNALKA